MFKITRVLLVAERIKCIFMVRKSKPRVKHKINVTRKEHDKKKMSGETISFNRDDGWMGCNILKLYNLSITDCTVRRHGNFIRLKCTNPIVIVK